MAEYRLYTFVRRRVVHESTSVKVEASGSLEDDDFRTAESLALAPSNEWSEDDSYTLEMDLWSTTDMEEA